MRETEWWGKFGHLVDRIWQYDDFLSEVVRHEYLAEMQSFLFKTGGRLLDFGCGTGCLSLPLAQRGMAVDGIDSSATRVRRARQQAQAQGLTNARFWCASRLSEEQRGVYDAVLLHAVVHHIPAEQQWTFLSSISDALVAGGNLYIYEPLAAMSNPPWQAWIVDRGIGVVLRILHWAALVGRLYQPEIAAAMCAGWTLRSPEEQPVRLDQLLDLLPPTLSILKISPWHCWSIIYANLCMSLRPTWRHILEHAAPLLYRLDRQIRTIGWYLYLRSWPMVSILARRTDRNVIA